MHFPFTQFNAYYKRGIFGVPWTQKKRRQKINSLFFTKQLSLTFSFQKQIHMRRYCIVMKINLLKDMGDVFNQNTTQRMSQPQANRGFTIETPPFEKAPADATHWSVTVSLNSKYRETSGQPRATSLFTKIPLVYSTTKMESNLIQHNGWVNPTPIMDTLKPLFEALHDHGGTYHWRAYHFSLSSPLLA